METGELKQTLRDAGLSPYQADAYVALLDLGAASATEIADASDVPAPRIYDVLDALEGEGYIETYEQGSLKARAHGLAEVLDDLRERADRFETAASELEERWEQPELESNKASIVKRFETVQDHAERIIEQAENQIQLSVSREQFETLRPALKAAHDRGVIIRVSVHTRPEEAPPSSELFEGACTEARHRSLPAPFVVLVDRNRTCFAPHRASFEQYGVLVQDQTHTYVFHWYYLTCLWEAWDRIYSARDDDPPRTYVDIRYCVRELKPLLDTGATIDVHVEGHDVETGDPRSVTGTVVDAVYASGRRSREEDRLLEMAGQVALSVRTEDGTVTVGGWGAVLEDIEATRIVVERIEPPKPTDEAVPETN